MKQPEIIATAEEIRKKYDIPLADLDKTIRSLERHWDFLISSSSAWFLGKLAAKCLTSTACQYLAIRIATETPVGWGKRIVDLLPRNTRVFHDLLDVMSGQGKTVSHGEWELMTTVCRVYIEASASYKQREWDEANRAKRGRLFAQQAVYSGIALFGEVALDKAIMYARSAAFWNNPVEKADEVMDLADQAIVDILASMGNPFATMIGGVE